VKREQRLRNEAEIALAREQGRSYSNRYVAMYMRPNQQEQSRIAVAAGKRLGKAHIRNRAKRLLREAINHRLSQLKPGVDLLLLARAACLGSGSAEVGAAVDDLLLKSKLIPAPPETQVLP
jgi:ribonuclease P protein component